MKIRDLMTKNVEPARPEDTIQDVARRMAQGDYGFVPVVEGREVIGAITDRDIAVRAVAAGMPGTTRVAEVMTREASYVFEDDSADEVLDKLGREQLRRMPVVNANRELVGVVALGDLAQKNEREAGEALQDISKPSGSTSFS